MIFCDWVMAFDKKMASENRQVLLFVNNCLSHNSAYFNEKLIYLKNTKLHFLPKNTTNSTQPLDAGIIKCVKHYYRRSIVEYFLTHTCMNINYEKNLKHINLFDAMNIISKCLKNKCGFIQCKVYTDPIADIIDHEEKINLSMYREFQAKTHCKLTYSEMKLITIPIQFERRILRALIDSGSADSYISEQYAGIFSTDSIVITYSSKVSIREKVIFRIISYFFIENQVHRNSYINDLIDSGSADSYISEQYAGPTMFSLTMGTYQYLDRNGPTTAVTSVVANLVDELCTQWESSYNPTPEVASFDVDKLGFLDKDYLNIVVKYSDVFNDKPGTSISVKHEIVLTDNAILLSVLNRQVNDMLKDGIIEYANSDWRSRAFLVPKSDGSQRLVIDYRKLNEMTKKDCYPTLRRRFAFEILWQENIFDV
ncbi:hypothetical protein A3Q56_06574 [Intoshia linei]|uniref:DDE-1 domain-containing protein n=1 Tax=Intoshia linei TaxID=1819745 RepID=A0A177AVI8_9BILA|nr:hypothetical protein A3Q56_06574 [Intoshia linei]